MALSKSKLPMVYHGMFLLVLAVLNQTVPAVSLSTTKIPTPSSAPPLHFFIGGLGYCGSRLAVKLRLEFPDCSISGCVRSEARRQSLLTASDEKTDIAVHVLDLDNQYTGLNEAGLEDLARATHIVQTIAPIADFDRDPLLALHSNILQDEASNLQWVGYLSSTGVYGDHGGDWIDEDSELRCDDAKSLARVKAELEWRELETHLREQNNQALIGTPPSPSATTTSNTTPRVDCFRCGGIYGPGRGPLDSALKNPGIPTTTTSNNNNNNNNDNNIDEEAIVPKYVNRILVDDICGAIITAVQYNNAAAASPLSGSIYNLVDDDPAPRLDVIAEANRLVQAFSDAPAPEEIQPSQPVSNGGGGGGGGANRRPISRNTGNKRCRNQRLKNEYAWEPLAPSYKEGMRICLESYPELQKK